MVWISDSWLKKQQQKPQVELKQWSLSTVPWLGILVKRTFCFVKVNLVWCLFRKLNKFVMVPAVHSSSCTGRNFPSGLMRWKIAHTRTRTHTHHTTHTHTEPDSCPPSKHFQRAFGGLSGFESNQRQCRGIWRSSKGVVKKVNSASSLWFYLFFKFCLYSCCPSFSEC